MSLALHRSSSSRVMASLYIVDAAGRLVGVPGLLTGLSIEDDFVAVMGAFSLCSRQIALHHLFEQAGRQTLWTQRIGGGIGTDFSEFFRCQLQPWRWLVKGERMGA